jgi:rare lipoprotein A
MASGERYDPSLPFAAHRTLPFGTVVRVTRVSNGKTVVVRITDRGPFGSSRLTIDLSRAAAERLDMIRAGVVEVRIEVLGLK